MAEEEKREYKLRCQLIGHEDDVRGLCAAGESAIATASRDGTVRLWSEQGPIFGAAAVLRGHSSFVGAVAWIPPSDEMPGGGLVSGGMDMNVIVWRMDSSDPSSVLRGHELQVTDVVIDKDGQIVSTSVDSTVRRWKKGGASEVLRGHKAPVQAAVVLPDGVLVTGSTDTTIKFWKGSSCTKSIDAHADTVRGLALMPNLGFLSASHDCSVKLWSYSGEQLLEMVGHTAIVYSVAGHSSGDVASGSEDGCCKIWRGGVCVQSIEHPGCVWDLQFLPNGDLVTACSDGVARVWTLDSNRYASPEDIATFEVSVSTRKLQKKTVGGVKVSELPGLEALQTPGCSDDPTARARSYTAVAYSWNMKEYKWDKVGEVVEGPEDAAAAGAKTLNGVTYDYVFDVDIEDGEPSRKLPYNRGDNPYDTADRWLLNENLPMGYRQQIVDFILRNTGQQANSFMQLDDCFYDPYTGGNAYVPRQNANAQPAPKPVPAPAYKLKHIPKTGITLFDSKTQADGILKKLAEFNTGSVTLSSTEMERIHAMVQALKNSSLQSAFSDSDFEILTKKLFLWPAANLFPVLDLLRIVVLDPQGANYFSLQNDLVLNLVKSAIQPPAPNANVFLSARVIVNCFRHECFHKWLLDSRSEIIDIFSQLSASPVKNIRSGYVHILLNYAVRVIAAEDENAQLQVLSAVMELTEPQEDDDIKFLALQTIGSLIHSGLVKSVAKDLDIQSVADACKKSGVSRIAEVGADIDHVLK